MKLVIPLAGKGTRLLPITRTVPKPLIRVAGRAVLDYVMDAVAGLDIEELIVITGHLKHDVEAYIRDNVSYPACFVEQKVQDGTAGAINLARSHVEGPLLIVFVDTIFEADLSIITDTAADGIIWAKEVEDYQRFGVIVTDEQGYMRRIVEKPSDPVSRLANIGVYYIRDSDALFAGIDWTLSQPLNQGEYFLTDAFQHMIDRGRKIKIAEVSGWYDCGKLQTTLDTNRHLLLSGRANSSAVAETVKIIPPVRIESGVTLNNCTIGPNVTVETRAVVENAEIADAILGAGSVVRGCTVNDTLIGSGATVTEDMSGMIVAADEVAVAP